MYVSMQMYVSMVAALKLEGNDGRAAPAVEFSTQFDSTRENSPGLDTARIDRLIAFPHFQCGGVWQFLVDGVLCLVNPVNDRVLRLLIGVKYDSSWIISQGTLCVLNTRSVHLGRCTHLYSYIF